MKIVFLDFDGVLNSFAFHNEKKLDETLEMNSLAWWAEMIDDKAVALLNEIVEKSGARVVISSTWRYAQTPEQLQQVLEVRGFRGKVIGATPRLVGEIRGKEIVTWLRDGAPEPVESFAILDDDADMGPLLTHLVHTDVCFGLERRHVERALELLGSAVCGG